MVATSEILLPVAQALLDALPHPAMIINCDRKILSANSHAREAGAEIGGYCWQTFAHAAFLSDEQKRLYEENPSASGLHCSFCRADQCLQNQSIENDPAVQAFDKILDTYWVAINQEVFLHYAIDVTDYAETRSARKKAEEKLRLILDSTAEGIYGLDRDGCCTFCNQRSLDMLGYSSEKEVIGRNMHELIHHASADRTPSPREDCLVSQIFSGEDHVHIPETVIRKADGSSFPAECWLHSMKENNITVGAVVTFVDISERKRQENALLEKQYYLSKAQELGKIGTWELDLENNILKWTLQNYEIFGVSEETPMDYELFLRCVHPDDRVFVDQEWRAALAGGPYDIEHGLLVHGRVKWVREKAEIHFDSAGKPFSAIGVTQDITERKHSEEENLRLISQLKEKSAEKERFIYTVSHDLKSPLVTISGFLGILEENFKSHDIESFETNTATIKLAIKRMRELLDELLHLSKIGNKELCLQKVNLGELIDRAMSNVSGYLAECSACVEIADELPEVNVDVADFMHVLENLIINAAKFSSEAEGGSLIRAGVRQSGSDLVFYLQDNGIGLERENLGIVFNAFERLGTRSEGTGLGLAIVKRIVERHGGQIWAESGGLGKGATICFTLP